MTVRRACVAGAGFVLVASAVLSSGTAQGIGGGGAPVGDGVHLFVVKIDAADRSCSGALVARQWVITAKSCFPESTAPGAPALPTTVTIGRGSSSVPTGQVVEVVQVLPRQDRDVALLRLARTVTDVVPVRIGGAAAATGENLVVAGYGRTATEWVPDRMHVGEFAVRAVQDTTFAVQGVSPGDATVCKGDAGGPALRTVDDGPRLVGLSSTSQQGGCLGESATGRAATQARVDDLLDWAVGAELDPVAKPLAKSVELTWQVPWSYSLSTFDVYGSTDPQVPIGAQSWLGNTGKRAAFTHQRLAPKQTWYYRVVAGNQAGGNSPASAVVSATTRGSTDTDFTGDGKEDIATFLRGDTGDVYVSRSTGSSFVEDDQLWHDYFAPGGEIPLSGDFDGDGRADAVTFLRGDSGDVYVALSTGSGFGAGALWHGSFAHHDEWPLVGDFNGDGRDDIVTFTRGANPDVYVSLSDGTRFVQSTWLWHDFFAHGDEYPAIGDFDGDGRDDIATFTRGTSADVFVALSQGDRFQPTATKWNDFFAAHDEVPAVGDFDGDGRDDIITFHNGGPGDVYVALSTGSAFGTGVLRNHGLSTAGTVSGVGDFDGDGRDDVVVFHRGGGGTSVSLSSASSAGPPTLWHHYFAPFDEVPVPRSTS